MSQLEFTTIILAAGQGTRMKSPLPKVLHPVAGYPMIQRVVNCAKEAGATEVRAVVGYSEKLVRQVLEPLGVGCYKQEKQLGTADAVKSADLESIEGMVLIINGDHPLLEPGHIKRIFEDFKADQADVSVVTSVVKDPGRLGRIVRHMGDLKAIVEVADASAETLKINEVNTGIYVAHAEVLDALLPLIDNHNAQGEFYLTDIIPRAVEEGYTISAIKASPRVAFGVNTQKQLARATKSIFKRKIGELMDEGVVVIDPANTYVEDFVSVGPGTVLYPGTYLRGATQIGSYCVVEPNCSITDSIIGDGVQVRAGSYFEKAEVHKGAIVGPYARLRPEAVIGEEAQIGNFVEVKKATFGKKAKAGHLTYIGDADIGEGTNIGCGTITCNYAVDKKKYRTQIGKNAFIGSDTQFIAPVTIGDNAVIGSGSTITKDVPEGALAVARGKQVIKENYVKTVKSDEENSKDEANSSEKSDTSSDRPTQ